MNKHFIGHTFYIGDAEIYGEYAKAKKEALAALEQYEPNKKIKFLWTRMEYTWSPYINHYIGSGNIENISSHYVEDGSNWLTVAEIKDILLNQKIDGTRSECETHKPEPKTAEHTEVLEELKA